MFPDGMLCLITKPFISPGSSPGSQERRPKEWVRNAAQMGKAIELVLFHTVAHHIRLSLVKLGVLGATRPSEGSPRPSCLIHD